MHYHKDKFIFGIFVDALWILLWINLKDVDNLNIMRYFSVFHRVLAINARLGMLISPVDDLKQSCVVEEMFILLEMNYL